jgi:hypothetical protein
MDYFDNMTDKIDIYPRIIKMNEAVKLSYALFISVAGILSFIVIYIIVADYRNLIILNESGISVTGFVTDLYKSSDRNGKYYQVKYAYDVASEDGENVHFLNQDSASEKEYYSLHIGNPINILYSQNNPTLSRADIDDRIKNTDIYKLLTEIITIILIVCTFFTFITFMILKDARKEKKLLKWGHMASGHIVKSEPYNAKGRILLKLSYNFIDLSGNMISGSIDRIPPNRKINTDTVTIFFDPKNSKRNILYPAKIYTIVTSYV